MLLSTGFCTAFPQERSFERIRVPPGESGFSSAAGVPSPHMCDQVSLFNDFTYKPMPDP